MLINEIKDGISFKNIKENLMLNVWENLKKEKQLIDGNETLNQEILIYVKKINQKTLKKI